MFATTSVALGYSIFAGSAVASSTLTTIALGKTQKSTIGFVSADPLRPFGTDLSALCGIQLPAGHKHAIDY